MFPEQMSDSLAQFGCAALVAVIGTVMHNLGFASNPIDQTSRNKPVFNTSANQTSFSSRWVPPYPNAKGDQNCAANTTTVFVLADENIMLKEMIIGFIGCVVPYCLVKVSMLMEQRGKPKKDNTDSQSQMLSSSNSGKSDVSFSSVVSLKSVASVSSSIWASGPRRHPSLKCDWRANLEILLFSIMLGGTVVFLSYFCVLYSQGELQTSELRHKVIQTVTTIAIEVLKPFVDDVLRHVSISMEGSLNSGTGALAYEYFSLKKWKHFNASMIAILATCIWWIPKNRKDLTNIQTDDSYQLLIQLTITVCFCLGRTIWPSSNMREQRRQERKLSKEQKANEKLREREKTLSINQCYKICHEKQLQSIIARLKTEKSNLQEKIEGLEAKLDPENVD